jgi:hypothetical protein
VNTCTFVDTGVLITAFQGKTGYATAAIALLEDPERELVATSLLKLELLPQPVFHQRKDEIAFYEAFFAQVSRWQTVDEELVSAALAEARRHPLSAMDGLHVAAALKLGATEFITTEKPGKPIYRVKAPRIIALSSLPLPS